MEGKVVRSTGAFYDVLGTDGVKYNCKVRGRIRLIEGDALLARMAEIVDKYEAGSEQPVSVHRMSPEYLNRQLKGITGFEIDIDSTEAAFKLSQNRDKANHERHESKHEK